MNRLVIEYDENTSQATTLNPIRIDDMLRVTFSLQLSALNDFMKQVKENSNISEKDLQTLKEHLYDSYNAGASNVLYLFAPDEELHPDLTVEAMKEAEDRYMYNHLNRENRRDLDKKTGYKYKKTNITEFPKRQNEVPNS